MDANLRRVDFSDSSKSQLSHGFPSTSGAPACRASSQRSRRGKSKSAMTGALSRARRRQNAVKTPARSRPVVRRPRFRR